MSPTNRLRLGVVLSGSGTTLQNLLDRSADGRLHAEVVLVVSNKPQAYGLERAKAAGVPTEVVLRKECASRWTFSERILDHCRAADVDLVCLAGFLQLLEVPPDFEHRIMNIHPALVPAFSGEGYYGRLVHEAVIQAGVKVTGCTVHFVDNEYDHGPIILQKDVPVEDDDTPDTHADRVQTVE
ncbi:MAG: phosphoribosylglycinamide formyltransferase, partial [Gemmataceae bacterium]